MESRLNSRAGPARGVVLAACLVLAVRGSRGRLSVVAEQVTGWTLDQTPRGAGLEAGP